MTPGGLNEFLQGYMFNPVSPCAQAQRLASSNRSDIASCTPEYGYLRDRMHVSIRTRYPVGDTVIPGTETKYGTADATAVIEFRCGYRFKGDPGDPVNFRCDGRDGFSIDPTDFDQGAWAALSKAIFAVHLVDD